MTQKREHIDQGWGSVRIGEDGWGWVMGDGRWEIEDQSLSLVADVHNTLPFYFPAIAKLECLTLIMNSYVESSDGQTQLTEKKHRPDVLHTRSPPTMGTGLHCFDRRKPFFSRKKQKKKKECVRIYRRHII